MVQVQKKYLIAVDLKNNFLLKRGSVLIVSLLKILLNFCKFIIY